MNHLSNDALALTALMLEAAIGYPAVVYRAIGHPVTWMGGLLTWLETRLNRPSMSGGGRRLCGIAAVAVLLCVSGGAAMAVERACSSVGAIGVVVLVLAAASLPAQRSLHVRVRAVAEALENRGLEAARMEVAMIVGRNTARLDETGVARAAIESLAENFSDGVVAPAVWLAIGGLAGAVGYKACNTADSMIGHRTSRYAAFGWAAARLDDLVNLPASRLSAVLLIVAAWVTGGSARGAVAAVWRDARRHRSWNAGWPEAAMAGALGLQLAGPRVYGETLVDDAFMGSGRREANAADVRRALGVYRAACVALWGLLLAVLVIWLG
jgi:adenosylcobinamide-phosphate synthase